MNKGIQHNIDQGNTKRDLQAQLDEARQRVLDFRARWKLDPSDNNRFALQTALSVENTLDKLLWGFE